MVRNVDGRDLPLLNSVHICIFKGLVRVFCKRANKRHLLYNISLIPWLTIKTMRPISVLNRPLIKHYTIHDKPFHHRKGQNELKTDSSICSVITPKAQNE